MCSNAFVGAARLVISGVAVDVVPAVVAVVVVVSLGIAVLFVAARLK